jgi:hypothetical protein
MAVSRPFVLVLIGAVLLAATLQVTRTSRQSLGDDDGAAAASVSAKPAPPAPAGKARPRERDRASAERSDGSKRSNRSRGRGSGSKPARDGLPRRVAAALARRQAVVLFFYQRGAADDGATARAVAGLRGRRGVAVFSDSVARVARYRSLVEGTGLAQAPAVVIIGPDRRATLVEGFVDAETLAQQVTDAR